MKSLTFVQRLLGMTQEQKDTIKDTSVEVQKIKEETRQELRDIAKEIKASHGKYSEDIAKILKRIDTKTYQYGLATGGRKRGLT